MEDRIRKIYCPMSETAYYILLSQQQERHGYSIGPGTMYGTLSKMEKERIRHLYQIVEEDDRHEENS